jgi:hypothetical protein
VDETGFNHIRGGFGSVYGGGNSLISLLEAATNVLRDFNMSTTMARQGGRVQLEQTDMRLALIMAKMANEGFSRTAIEETKCLIKKQRAEVQEEKKWGVEFPGHNKVKGAIQRQQAMLCQKQMSGYLSWQNGTAMNQQTRWICKGTSAPPLARRRVRTPQPTPPPPSTPPTPPATTGNTAGAQPSEIVHLPVGQTYSHTAFHLAEFFEDDKETEHDTVFDQDTLTEND